MSYDLYLFPKAPFGLAEFAAYFSGREHYELTGDRRDAFYDNPDTGTYFSFAFVPADDGGEDDADALPDWPGGNHIAFNINYFRPHVFGLEAAGHLNEVVVQFGCRVYDPQSFEEVRDWSPNDFLNGWNDSNATGYGFGVQRTVQELQDSSLESAALNFLDENETVCADGAMIEAVWAWNSGKEKLQEELGGGVLVPRIFWGLTSDHDNLVGQPMRLIVWASGVATILPDLATHAIIRLDRWPRWLFSVIGQFAPHYSARRYLVDLADVRPLLDAGLRQVETGSTVIPHGPEGMPDAFLRSIEAAWPSNKAGQNRLRIYPGGRVRNREMINVDNNGSGSR